MQKLALFETSLKSRQNPPVQNSKQEHQQEEEDWAYHQLKFTKRPQDFSTDE
jgi:hypothetical protein